MKRTKALHGLNRRRYGPGVWAVVMVMALLLVPGFTSPAFAQDGTNTGPIHVNPGTTFYSAGQLTNNSSSTFTNNGSIVVKGSVNFQAGKIDEPTSGIVTFLDGATATNGSDTSHVDGLVRKVGNDAFTFPVGDGGRYGPVGISAPANATDQIEARYWLANPQTDAGTALGAGLASVSSVEYWNVSGTPTVNLTLYWNSNSGVAALSNNVLANLRVAGWNGTQWVNLGNNGTTGNGTVGTISANGVTPNTYQAYTIAAAATPDLKIGKSGPATATQGTNFSYTLVVTNTSTVATSGVITVTDPLPAGLSFVSGSGGFTCTAGGQNVTCTSSAVIAVNGTATITLTVNPTTTGVKSNTASVIGGGDTSTATSNTVNTTVNSASAAGIEYKLLYNSTTNRYEVWLRPTHTPGAPNQTVTGQVTIKAPHIAGAGAFTPTSTLAYTATLWTVGSVVRAPSEAAGYDYLSFDLNFPTGNTGAFAWQAGVERLAFSFQNGGVCSGSVTLMANNDAFNVYPNSAGSNPGNAIEVVTLGNDPGNDFLGDYSSGAAVCPIASSVTLPVKLFLQGPYLRTTGLMTDTLRSKGLVPTSSPYTATATTTAGVLATTGNNAIVDWVLVEVRNSATPTTVVARRSALLQRDGDVVAVDGTSTLTFTLATGNYHVAVKHRNHLNVMTAAPVAMSATTPLVDFTISAGYGAYGQATVGSVYALWMGNTSGDNRVIGAGPTNDRNAILAEALSAPGNANHNANYIVTGYSNGDVNLDGRVIAAGPGNDINFILYDVFVHPGNGSAAANFVVQGQVP